ncbi:MAG: winged helix DNA-binding protein [Burkholderiales bacterium]|nr:winged helix DNA-binding protein [Burkholderiales bacterium]
MRKSNDNVNHSCDSGNHDVLELIHTVMHQYRSQQYQALRDGPHDITHMESKVLNYFARHASATQSDLARDTGRDKAQLARLIKGLRERGLLDAIADAQDRRNVRLTLTADGTAILQELHTQAKHLTRKALAGFAQQEQAQLFALLQRVNANLNTPT